MKYMVEIAGALGLLSLLGLSLCTREDLRALFYRGAERQTGDRDRADEGL
jgi:hypothetical protein